MRGILLGLLFILFYGTSLAQEKTGGQIFESNSKTPIAGISIENLNSHARDVSAHDGSFTIKAKVGDILTFSGSHYQPDTLYLTSIKKLKIFLSLQSRQLGEVKVTAQEITTGGFKPGPTTGPLNSQTVQYQTDAAGHYIGGVKFMLHDWNKDENKRGKEQKFLQNEGKKAEIAKVFSPENLKNYLNIKDQELQNFITLYIPDVKKYTDSNFDLLSYLNACYKEFIKIPARQRQSEDFLKLNE